MDNNELNNNEQNQKKYTGINGNGNGHNQNEDTEPHKMIHLSGMYQDWFLDYASYVILERAVPHIKDGLKPVHRRILHAMRKMEDGSYNKVANIIGFTMQYHPHGDASIQDALVQLGQKGYAVDPQGNWGNIYTGDRAAASRYIEARLTKFAQEVIFNHKTTEWKVSYDGRNQEPVTLPVKFPLLLLHGVEGIAVGLASKILPHNFNEITDAAILYLKDKDFELYPDFPTGGLADCSRYNDGMRGGNIKVRARITKADKKTLAITDLPYGKNTNTLIDSIIKANEKGKIKIKHIDDNTAENVEILVHLAAGSSPDKTIDALYAFTDCEISISPNACVIEDEKPVFMDVKGILKKSVDNTVTLLTQELEIRKNELQEAWHMSSLEKIFIENKIYNHIEECETWEAIIQTIDKGLEPFKKLLIREVTEEDITKLTEIKIKKISKFDKKKADEYIKSIEAEVEEVNKKLNNIIPHTIEWFSNLKKKYGKGYDRKTEIRNFHTIEATKVVESNKKLYVNKEEGFIGTGLKKDEFVCDCSDIDDIIVFLKNGKYYITKVDEKVFVGKNIIHARVFKKNDTRTIFNVIYRDGYKGNIMAKRTAITGAMRAKEYDITKGTEGSEIHYFSANPNGEAEVITVYLKPRPRLKKRIFDFDFGDLAIKGKNSQGNIISKYALHKIKLKEKGASTLGDRKRWFDFNVLRLNNEGNGKFLGEFKENEKIMLITKAGEYKLTSFDLTTYFEDNIAVIEKLNPSFIYTVVYFDGAQNNYYIKRFKPESTEKELSIIGDDPKSKMIMITDEQYPCIEVILGNNTKKEKEHIDADDFIGVKNIKARGKKLTSYKVKKINKLEPLNKNKEINSTDKNNISNDKQPHEVGKDESSSKDNSIKSEKTKPQTEKDTKDKPQKKDNKNGGQMYFEW
jgi:topoisomerase-4 subunit A